MVTFEPRDSRMAAIEAAALPLPSEETTPLMTKMNLAHNEIPVLECVILT